MTQVGKKLGLLTAAGLLLLSGGLVCTGWGLTTYLKLVNLREEIVDGAARVDAASRGRLELVANLLYSEEAFERLGGGRLAAVHRTCDELRGLTFTPGTLADPVGYEAFIEAQRELSAALAAFWPSARKLPEAEAQGVLDDLESRLRRAEAGVGEGLDRLGEHLVAYREACGRFPGSLLVGLAGRIDMTRGAPATGPGLRQVENRTP